MRRSDKLIAKEVTTVMLYRGYSTSHELFYAFLAITADKLADLRKTMQKQGSFDLRRFGTVLAAGFGDPDAEVCQEMIDKYGYDFANAVDITADMHAPDQYPADENDAEDS